MQHEYDMHISFQSFNLVDTFMIAMYMIACNVHDFMIACNIPVTGWEALATNRTAWRQCTVSGVRSFEEQRLDQLDAKRQARKNRGINLTAAVACPVCGQICALEFGLRSLQRRH